MNPLESKAHELLGQLNPGQIAVVHLLEVLVHEGETPDVEPVTEEDSRRFHEGQAFFASRKGIPMDDLLADFGATPEEFPLTN